MITEVAEAVMKKFKSCLILKTALAGRLYFQQAPQNVSSPYGVFSINGSTYEELMGGADDNMVTVDLQFNLYSSADDGGQDIASLAEQLDGCFNWQELNADGYRYIKMQRESIADVGFVDEIWQVTVMYSLGIQKE